MTDVQFIFIASFGALVQEIIHLYELRAKITEPASGILKSRVYWVITIAMIITSGIGTWILYGDTLEIKSVVFILGAAFPSIFKKVVAGAIDNRETVLGGFSVRDYFI
ncbi:MAG: hypothetical protein QHC79_25760 [Pseudosphingobacterium sp.]|nr:hypothetical protein [Pseudosphingobacterium sp.]